MSLEPEDNVECKTKSDRKRPIINIFQLCFHLLNEAQFFKKINLKMDFLDDHSNRTSLFCLKQEEITK